jgi:hypothetical protein
VVGVLSKRPDMRMNTEIEQHLVPLIKRIDAFKEKVTKEHSLADIASMLRYEQCEIGTILSDDNDYHDKFYILLNGTISV